MSRIIFKLTGMNDSSKAIMYFYFFQFQVTQRISERFQEIQMLSNENAVAAAQKLGKMPGV